MTYKVLKVFDSKPGTFDELTELMDSTPELSAALCGSLSHLLCDMDLHEVQYRGEIREHQTSGVTWYEVEIIVDNDITYSIHTRNKYSPS